MTNDLKTVGNLKGKAEDDVSRIPNTKRGDRPPVKKPVLDSICLSQVIGLHPVIEALKNELGLPPLKKPMDQALNEPGFKSILRRNPIWVTKESNQLRCIGNIHAYASLCAVFKPDTKIHCLEVFEISHAQIKANFINETLFTPALFGIHFSELNKLAEFARRVAKQGLWVPHIKKGRTDTPNDSDVDKHFAKIYGVCTRKIKSKVEPKSKQPTLDAEDELRDPFLP